MLRLSIHKTGLSLALLGLLAACTPKTIVEPTAPAKPGVPTAVGQPVGPLVSKTIGPAGGSLTSADGTMTLRFPAGALTKETLITAQPVENTAFGGAGVGYEFGPHGTQFAKPVTLSWTYKDSDLHGSTPEALGVAFQDDKHIWRGRTNLFFLKEQHRVIAPIYHFSRYSFYENFWMEPMKQTLAPNETVEIKVFFQENHGRYSSTGSDAETQLSDGRPTTPADSNLLIGNDMLSPLIAPVYLLKGDQARNWRVNGQDVTNAVGSPIGILSAHDGKSVTYKAPTKAPDVNPVAVSVEITPEGHGKLLLIGQFTIESPNELYIGGARQPNAYANADIAESAGLVFIGPEPYQYGNQKQTGVVIGFMGSGGPGTFKISKENAGKFSLTAIGPDGLNYSQSYTPPPYTTTIYGPGSATITELNPARGLIAGSFTATLHHYDVARKIYKSLQVRGRFRTGS